MAKTLNEVGKTLAGDATGRSRGRAGQYPVPSMMGATGSGPVDKQDDAIKIEKAKSTKKDLGFGFNEEGFPLQDKYEFQGMPIEVENKKGSTRYWYDDNGKEKGSTKMHHDYGYVAGTKGSDGEDVDVYIGPDENAERVYVIHQNKFPDFECYDEDKVMLGFSSEEEARDAYLKQYDDPRFYNAMSSMPLETFVNKLETGGKITNERRILNAIIESLKEAPPSIGMDDFGDISTIPAAPAKKVGVSQMDGRGVILKNIFKLKKRGVPIGAVPKMLGIGTRGTVFELPQNRVLKVTDDKSEAVAANKIKTLGHLKHVYQVFDVFQFPNTEMYGIVQEKLTPLSGTPKDLGRVSLDSFSGESRELMGALVNLNFFGLALYAHNWENLKQSVIARASAMSRDLPNANKESVENFLKQQNASWKYIVNFGIKGMFEELTSAGIQFNDYHPGNIMRRADGTPVIVDIGHSKVVGGQDPDVLEKKIAETVISMLEAPKKKLPVKQFGGRDISAIGNTDKFSEKDIVNVIKKNSVALGRKGIVVNTASSLGNGSYGIAYEISINGKRVVLKVTGDPTEAKASNLIKGKGLEYLVRVFDVFRFKGQKMFYGIVQEKLDKLSSDEESEFEMFIETLDAAASLDSLKSADWDAITQEVRKATLDEVAFREFLVQAKRFNFKEIMDDLKRAGIEFLDFHAGNIMKRGVKFVLIDLGASRAPGATEPDMLERKLIRDGKVDSVGITIGRYQPFHRGHAEIIRKLAQKHTKVIIFVAGLKKDDQNPFSYETRIDLMKASLPDVESKLEVYRAEDTSGKQTGYMPALISRIITDKNSTVEKETSGNITVGPDRAQEMKKQIEHAAQVKEKDQNALQGFDPTVFVVEEMPALKNDGDTDRVSGTKVRAALEKNDREAVKSMLDPHVSSDESKFDELFDSLKAELGLKENINEDLASAGGSDALMSAAAKSANIIKIRLGIDMEKAKILGQGQKGVALDVGGGKVLKLTTDEREANAAHSLEGKATSKIARVFKVYKLKDKAGSEDVFVIEQEKVDPISSDEGREFDATMKMISDADDGGAGDGPMTALAHGDVERMYKFLRVFWAKDAREDMQYPVGSAPNPRKETKLANAIANREAIVKKTFEKFQVAEMMDELKKNNIQFADYHAGNIGKRGGDYVVFDLGESNVDGGTPPPVLERIISSVLASISEAGVPASPTDFAPPNARVQSSYWSSGNIEEPDPRGDEESRSDSRASHEKLYGYALPPAFESIVRDVIKQVSGTAPAAKK